MSHIPNSAMPHARADDSDDAGSNLADTMTAWMGRAAEQSKRLRERARAHPGAVISAAATAAVAVAAAMLFPRLRRRGAHA